MQVIQLEQITTNSNRGINKEWAFARAMGIERTKHDNKRFDEGSDVEVNGIGYSVKSARFSLMSGSITSGMTEFGKIWEFYKARVHSTKFVYVANNGNAYIMNINEFEKFIYQFCKLERESGSQDLKIRAGHESKKMIEWLSRNA